jgi:uncharacterized lipoprotein YmbA
MARSPSCTTLFTCMIILASFLAGCGSSPPARMYTLNSLGTQKSADSATTKDFVVVRIGPIEIPDYLDRPQIVTRTSQNELNIAEFEQWGGPLASDINRSLVENLASAFGGSNITVVPWRAYVVSSYKVPIGIERFDVTPGKSVVLKARWAVIGKDNVSPEIVRESAVMRPLKGSQYSEMVAAMSEALADLSSEMVEDIKSAVQTGQKRIMEDSKDKGGGAK